jgi:hypothetical protein
MSRLQRIKNFFTPKVVALLLMAAAAAAAVGFWMYMRYDPGSASVCATCHNMAPFISNIANTPHGAFSCAECHSLDFPRWIYVQITENPTSQQIAQRYNTPMFAQCLNCHAPQRLTQLNIHKTHLALAQRLSSCTVCHNPHELQTISASCQTCHDLDKVLQTHLGFHNYAWAQVDAGRYEVCLECHSPWAKWYVPIGPDCQIGAAKGTPCIGCHGPRAMPFAPAQFTDCARCHGR